MSNSRMDTKTITSLAMLTGIAYVVMLCSKLLPSVNGFLDFDLAHLSPEFYATFKLLNVKNHEI